MASLNALPMTNTLAFIHVGFNLIMINKLEIMTNLKAQANDKSQKTPPGIPSQSTSSPAKRWI